MGEKKKLWKVEWWRNGTKMVRTFSSEPSISGFSCHTVIDGDGEGTLIIPRELFAELKPVEVEE